MRRKKEIEALHASGELQFGYVDITQFNCPPFVMFTNHGDCGICGFQLLGLEYEPHSTYVWSKLVREATSIFDIGTRCGEYSLIAASLRDDIPIVSCEPNPDGFARLQVNMLANGVKNMHISRVAIGGEAGLCHFAWIPKAPGHISSGGRLQPSRYEVSPAKLTQTVVVVTTLDILTSGMEVGQRPVMKIDVEGAEIGVFKGMAGLLQRRPDIILETFAQEACDAITAMTRPLGYNYFLINEKQRSVIQRADLLPASIADEASEAPNQILTTRTLDQLMAVLAR